jgi:hypothetical protein
MADFIVPKGAPVTDAASQKSSPVQSARHVKVIIVGAGASGLLMAYKLQKHFDHLTFIVYEKNRAVSGTWFENKYPGLATAPPFCNCEPYAEGARSDALATCQHITTLGPSNPRQTGQRPTPQVRKSTSTSTTLQTGIACASTFDSCIKSPAHVGMVNSGKLPFKTLRGAFKSQIPRTY